jgi:hypothetical protein
MKFDHQHKGITGTSENNYNKYLLGRDGYVYPIPSAGKLEDAEKVLHATFTVECFFGYELHTPRTGAR